MSIDDFKNRLNLILEFITKMDRELIPSNTQKVYLRVYATTLKIDLTDKMIDDIIYQVY